MKFIEKETNLIITGVGGQGNVKLSQLIGETCIRKGYFVTIGETYGSSQRGGAVMSHVRVSSSRQPSPLIPKGKADLVLALEPVEGVRVLSGYGNPNVVTIVNTRPFYPVDVNSGEADYPEMESIMAVINDLSREAYYLAATDKAMEMGSPVLGNMIMVGALIELKLFPLEFQDFSETLASSFSGDQTARNITAVKEGMRLVGSARSKEAHS